MVLQFVQNLAFKSERVVLLGFFGEMTQREIIDF